MFSFSSLVSIILTPVMGVWLLFISFMLLMTPAFGSSSIDELREKYEEIEDDLLENIYDIPIYIESNNGDGNDKNLIHGNVYGIVYHPFNKVSHALSSVTSLCEIMPQHLNIKACTYEYINNQCRLTLYSGRKFYQKADDVQHLNYKFNVTSLNDEYFFATLNAKEDPLDTKDSNVSVAAIPLTDNSTFFQLIYEHQYSFLLRFAITTYLATFGYDKIGFSVIGKDENNNLIYVGGIRGVIERNVMRYYFAIKSYLNTQAVEKNKRFESRISYWFDLTERYHKQLYEMDKSDYLKYKILERHDQLRLQKVINESINTEKEIKIIPNRAEACVSKNKIN